MENKVQLNTKEIEIVKSALKAMRCDREESIRKVRKKIQIYI